MRRLIVQQWATADTIVAEEGGGLSFVTAQPFGVSTEEDFKASAMAFIDSVGTMILGANTFAMAQTLPGVPSPPPPSRATPWRSCAS